MSAMFQENGEVWAAGTRDLQDKLDEYYGAEGIWCLGDFHHEERDEILYDVLAYFDGEQEHFIDDDVPMLGHGPSGAVGMRREDLPPKERVREVVDAAENGGIN